VCSQNQNQQDSALSQDEQSSGFCECPVQKLVDVTSERRGFGDLVTTAEMRSLILAEDPHYLEQMCVPVRQFNETCLYPEQCRAIDANADCRPMLTQEGVESSERTCNCADGFTWSTAAVPAPKCLRDSSASFNQNEVDFDDGDDEDYQDGSSSTSRTTESLDAQIDRESNHSHNIYIWWIFPPEESAMPPCTRTSHGIVYYGSRLFNLSNVAYLLMLIAVTMPAIIILLMLIFYCHRRMMQARQFAPRRTSFGTDSIFYPEDGAIPSTPSEKTKSTVTFDFTGESRMQNSAPATGLFGSSKRTKGSGEDKLDLVDNDQLEQMHKFP